MESILTSIKKLLGIDESYDNFDTDIIIHINAALATLSQLGVGPDSGFRIEDSDATWDDFIGDDPRLDFVRDYVYCKVRLIFDPPTSSAAMEALKQAISEYEWRAMVQCDR